MSSPVLLHLVLSTGVFMLANSLLKTYAAAGGLGMLAAALAAFCLGNGLMVRVMRDSGLGAGLALSLVFQLVGITLIAALVFGERPGALQLAGLGLGAVSIVLIAWPGGGKA